MESPPPMFEFGDKDKDGEGKEKKTDDKKSSVRFPLRSIRPASDIHGSEPQTLERPLFPLFTRYEGDRDKADKPKEETEKEGEGAAEEQTPTAAVPAAETAAEPAQRYAERDQQLGDLEGALWSQYEPPAPAPAAEAPSAPPAELDMPAVPAESTPVPNDEPLTMWHESSPVRPHEAEKTPETPPLRQTSETAPAAPSTAGMAAEVAATEPDPEAVTVWEQAREPGGISEAPQPIHAETLPAPPAEIPPAELVSDQSPTPPPAETPRFATAYPPSEWYPSQYAGYGYGPRTAESIVDQATGAGLVAGAAAGAVTGAITGHYAGKRVQTQAMRQFNKQVAEQGQQIEATHEYQRATYRQNEQIAQDTRRLAEAQPQPQVFAPGAARRPAAETPRQPFAEAQPLKQTPETAMANAAAAVAEAEEQAHTLAEPGYHTIESAWHRVEVDAAGRMREGQEFGHGLHEEQRAEMAPRELPTAAAAAAAAQMAAQYDHMAQAAPQPLSGAVNPMIGSGQMGPASALPSAQTDMEHRLEPPRHPFVTAISSPLLWVGVIVLVLAFLAAAFL